MFVFLTLNSTRKYLKLKIKIAANARMKVFTVNKK